MSDLVEMVKVALENDLPAAAGIRALVEAEFREEAQEVLEETRDENEMFRAQKEIDVATENELREQLAEAQECILLYAESESYDAKRGRDLIAKLKEAQERIVILDNEKGDANVARDWTKAELKEAPSRVAHLEMAWDVSLEHNRGLVEIRDELKARVAELEGERKEIEKTVIGLVLYADGHRADYNRRAEGNLPGDYWKGRRDEAGHFKDRIERFLEVLQKKLQARLGEKQEK